MEAYCHTWVLPRVVYMQIHPIFKTHSYPSRHFDICPPTACIRTEGSGEEYRGRVL